MKVPILQSKLGVPATPVSYVPRPRLDRLWDEWARKQLVLVTAGAGFGKTSFLAANARASKGKTCWYAIDSTDTDLTTFCAHLDQLTRPADRAVRPEVDVSDPNFVSAVLARLVRSLRERRCCSYLVFDDVHLLVGSTEVLHFLERLIRFLPAETTLVLASREPVGIATMKLQSLGAVASLTSKELALNEEEVAALFDRHFPGASLSQRLRRKIISQTEGWAAGTEIFFQVLDGSSPERIGETLERLGEASSGWFTYFAEEVVRQLDPETRDFLFRSSVLPTLDPDMCDHVLRIESSRLILDRLTERNLFTFRTASTEASYRYHHLFRDFLQDRLERTVTPARVRTLRRRAAAALNFQPPTTETGVHRDRRGRSRAVSAGRSGCRDTCGCRRTPRCAVANRPAPLR